MDYFLVYQGQVVGRTNEETTDFTRKKCEQLRKKEVGWIRLGDVKADMCFGVIEGEGKNTFEPSLA